MALLPIIAASAVALSAISVLAASDDGFSWSQTSPSSAAYVQFAPEERTFQSIPSEFAGEETYPVYYAVKLTRDDLPSNFSFDSSKLPSHGPGWPGVYESVYLVREAYTSDSVVSTASSAWLACYFQLGFGTSGYYPLYSSSGRYWTVPTSEFPPMSADLEGDGVVWLYNFGSFLTTQSVWFNDILNFEIGGHKLVYLMASSAIFVYMGWCVVKFFVPI